MSGLQYTALDGDDFAYDRSSGLLTVNHSFYADCPPSSKFEIVGRYASVCRAELSNPDLWREVFPREGAPVSATYVEIPNPDSSQITRPFDKWRAEHNRLIEMHTQYSIPHNWIEFFDGSKIVDVHGNLIPQYLASLRLYTIYNDAVATNRINMTSLESYMEREYLYVDQWHGEY